MPRVQSAHVSNRKRQKPKPRKTPSSSSTYIDIAGVGDQVFAVVIGILVVVQIGKVTYRTAVGRDAKDAAVVCGIGNEMTLIAVLGTAVCVCSVCGKSPPLVKQFAEVT